AALARVVHPSAAPADDVTPPTGEAPLLPIQQAFFAQTLAAPHHWNQAIVVRSTPLALAPLRAALQTALDHHDALRSRFVRRDGEWTLHIPPAGERVVLDLIEVGDDRERLRAEADRLQRGLDLGTGPVFRAALFRCGDDDRLLMVAHHLVVDSVSWQIIVDDLETAYVQACGGKPMRLPAKTPPVRRWAERLQEWGGIRAGLHRDHWRRVTLDAAALPIDHDRGSNTAGSVDLVSLSLGETLTRQL